MQNLYFDESIRKIGDFIIGALVVTDRDLSAETKSRWSAMGLDPSFFEYKSSSIKQGDHLATNTREVVSLLLLQSKLALIVCPMSDRHNLGDYCVALIRQLVAGGLLASNSQLYADQGIGFSQQLLDEVKALGIVLHGEQDSKITAGIQIADHAAHALGGMLLEEMGLLNKIIKVPDYDDEIEINLGFELWARLRYSLLGVNEHVVGMTDPDSDFNPYFQIEGYGLYIAPSCNEKLTTCARSRFGSNYLGCID